MPPQTGASSGFLQSPSWWNNLAAFGANMSVAANARTPDGYLAYGNGFAGPLGAGVLGAQQASQQNALMRANLARSGAETQGQQLQNLITGLTLPYLAARTKFQANILNQIGQEGDADSAASPVPPQQTGSLSSTPFIIPQGKRQKLVQDAVAGTPIQPETLDGLVNYESGWDANNVNPSTHATGLGQILPSTAASPGYGMAPVSMSDLGNPANNLKFAAQYLYARGKALGMQDADWKDPGKVAGVLAAYHGPQADANGVNGASYAAAVGKAIQGPRSWEVAQNGGTTAPGAAPQQGAPQLPFAGAGSVEQAAALADNLDRIARLHAMAGLPDAQMLHDKAQAYRNFALGAYKNMDVRQGGMAYSPAFGWVKNPDRVEIQNPDGSKSYAYTAPPAPGEGGSGTIAPVTGAGGAPIVAQNSPITQAYQEARGKDVAEQREEIDKDATNAVEDNFRWDQMRQESQSWNMNRFAPTFQSANAYLQATAETLGIKIPGLDQKVGDYQAFNKNAGNLVREAVRETSARASQQEYKMIAETLPTAATSRDAFGQIADQMQGLNDWEIARQRFAAQYKGGPDSMSVALNSNLSPAVFMLHRMTMTPDGQQRFSSLFAKMQETPFGRTMANEIMKKYQFAQANGYFDTAPTQ